VTDDVDERVLCLPIYFDLTHEQVRMISRTFRAAGRPQVHHREPARK
jgi:hypothetical protein